MKIVIFLYIVLFFVNFVYPEGGNVSIEDFDDDSPTNTTELETTPQTHIRAKRQWGGCGYWGCGGCGPRGCGYGGYGGCGPNGCGGGLSCGANGCGYGPGCSGVACGPSNCAYGVCGTMCCQNRFPRPCVGCGLANRCCPCCMPRCAPACVRGGGCYCDYDYGGFGGGYWGRKRRHALEFNRTSEVSPAPEATTAQSTQIAPIY